jgi:hypothetical protein
MSSYKRELSICEIRDPQEILETTPEGTTVFSYSASVF